MLDCGFCCFFGLFLLLLRFELFLLVDDVAGFESIVAVDEDEEDDLVTFCVFFLLRLTMNNADDDTE